MTTQEKFPVLASDYEQTIDELKAAHAESRELLDKCYTALLAAQTAGDFKGAIGDIAWHCISDTLDELRAFLGEEPHDADV